MVACGPTPSDEGSALASAIYRFFIPHTRPAESITDDFASVPIAQDDIACTVKISNLDGSSLFNIWETSSEVLTGWLPNIGRYNSTAPLAKRISDVLLSANLIKGRSILLKRLIIIGCSPRVKAMLAVE